MKTNKAYEFFVEALKSRFPEKKKMTSTLMEILCMERESVYRRLRGDVLFSFHEMSILSKEFHISLDSIMEASHNKEKNSTCIMTHVDYFNNPSEIDYKMAEGMIDFLQVVKEMPYSESGTATNTIPTFFYLHYPSLLRFNLLKWAFQNCQLTENKSLKEVNISERFQKIWNEWNLMKEIHQTTIIWDKHIFESFVNDINYFRDIRRITQEDVANLKSDTKKLLDQLESIARDGKFENGNSVQLYVSQLNMDTTHTYVYANPYTHLTLLKGFTITDIYSMDLKVTERMRTWMKSLQRTSTLISETAEAQRLHFFEKQREIVEQLI
ncbi:MAG: hypothetical protein LUD74_07375 [Tannerellaceae bacterium]|nr:hypothetical protein [Tannerellaceae bacterium]